MGTRALPPSLVPSTPGGAHVLLGARLHVAFQVGQRRRCRAWTHVGPDQSAALLARVGDGRDLRAEVTLSRLVGHVDAVARDVELPAVVDAAQTRLLVAS